VGEVQRLFKPDDDGYPHGRLPGVPPTQLVRDWSALGGNPPAGTSAQEEGTKEITAQCQASPPRRDSDDHFRGFESWGVPAGPRRKRRKALGRGPRVARGSSAPLRDFRRGRRWPPTHHLSIITPSVEPGIWLASLAVLFMPFSARSVPLPPHNYTGSPTFCRHTGTHDNDTICAAGKPPASGRRDALPDATGKEDVPRSGTSRLAHYQPWLSPSSTQMRFPGAWVLDEHPSKGSGNCGA